MLIISRLYFILFFFNDTATTEIYTLSLHDALPIFLRRQNPAAEALQVGVRNDRLHQPCRQAATAVRSEEHTSELQSRFDLVCRLLLEKKKRDPSIHSLWHRRSQITADNVPCEVSAC